MWLILEYCGFGHAEQRRRAAARRDQGNGQGDRGNNNRRLYVDGYFYDGTLCFVYIFYYYLFINTGKNK